MAQQRLSFLMRQVCRSATALGAGTSDTELLDRYVQQRDGAAFELLVWRHQRLVWGLCRRMVRCEQDAEDAFQATFLALACKAASIGKRQAVASWLYKVAYRLSLRQRAADSRRLQHEQSAALGGVASRCTPPAFVLAIEADLRSALHEEINRLPEAFRAPVILCYLEGRTNEEAAARMCCPTGTIVTRLARARKQLRSRLARRGLTLPAGYLVTALVPSDLSAARHLLVDRTIRAALLFAADPTAAGVVSAKVATLTQGVVKTMMITRLKLVFAVLLMFGFIGMGSGVLAYCQLPQDEPAQQLPSTGHVSALPVLALQTEQSAADKTGVQQPDSAKDDRQKKDSSKEHKVQETVSKSFKVGKTPRVIVELHNGSIEVDATAESSVEAKVTKQGYGKTEQEAQDALKKVEVKMTQEGDIIRIQDQRSPDATKSKDTASAEVKVPPGSTLELQTKNGSVTVTAGTGKVRVQTLNGSIHTTNSKGPLDLHTSNGAIRVKEATGQLELKTLNGTIDVQGDKAVVNAQTTNGSVHFRGTLAKGESSLKTTNGQVELTLPAGSSFRLDATTLAGKIQNEFGTESVKGKGQLQTTVGQDPVVDIRLRTTHGSVSVRRESKK